MTKEFVQNNMSNLLEDIRRNGISINLGIVDTMWVCDVMNDEKMDNLISFVYESPQCDTPVDALYDAYTWLIKNGKIETDCIYNHTPNNPQITIGTKIRSKTSPNVILRIISNDCHGDKFECSNGCVLSLKQIEKYYDIII